MCGISAVLSNDKTKCFSVLINSLRALQNRGYDSCGMIDSNFKCLLRAVKKDDDAVKKLSLQEFPDSHVGMAHTRWATSGRKTINNAHPHVSSDGKIAVVHNGIIENYVSLKKELKEWEFHSETDTEVISNFLARSISSGNSMMEALEEANQKLEGTWAIVVMCKDYPDSVFVSRNGNPLLVGFNTQNNDIMISSEVSGFVNQVDTYSILEDNQFLEIKRNIKPNLTFQKVPAEIIHLTPGDFPHFMAKEIYDQTEAIYGPCQWNKYKKIKDIPELQQLKPLKESVEDIDLILIGCGTSFHSCLSSKWFFNKIRSVKCVVASEFTNRDIPKGRVVAVFVSQSGETLDTYRALKIVKEHKVPTISLVNVSNSLIARECDYRLHLYAGREVGVASTKAYVTQIIGLHLLSLFFSDGEITDDYLSLSNQIKIILKRYFPFLKKDGKNIFVCSKELMPIIQSLDKQNHGFTLSSGSLRATSYEGSLKIKEVGRIFIQGYPTSSLKHGPFSLIEEGIPIIFTLQKGDEDVLRRTNSAIEEVHLRGAKIYVITDIEDYENEKVDEMIKIPHNKTFSSILSIIPFQILSYYVAGFRGFDCDRPINLAKCVTTD